MKTTRRKFLGRCWQWSGLILIPAIARAQNYAFGGQIIVGGPKPPPGGWTPTSPSNTLVEWLDATTQAFADGDPVGTWVARAGQNATSTSTARPLFKTNIKNGNPIVRFDGVNDNLITAVFSVEQVQPFTTAVVFKFAATGVQFVFDGIAKRAAFFNNVIVWDAFAGSTVAIGGTADTNWHILFIEWNGASSKYRFDGGSETAFSGTPGANNMDGLTLGASNTLTSFASVDIGEIVIYSSTLGSSDKTSLFTYLNTKWAVY